MLTKSSLRIAVLSLLFIFVVSSASAQKYYLGAAYVKDGIPCIIIDMDEDGKKGLIMTAVPKISKEMQKAIEAGEETWFYIPKKEKGAEKKLREEYVKEFYSQYKCDTFAVRTSGFTIPDRITTSLSGKENMKNVIAFCNEKEISMETYFPRYAWAQSLGEGWYIPGVDELQLYVRLFYHEGIGEQYALTTIERGKKITAQAQAIAESTQEEREVQIADAIAQGIITAEEGEKLKSGKVGLKEAIALTKKMSVLIGYNPLDYNLRPEYVASSTIATTRTDNNADKGCEYLCLCPIYQKATMKHWFDMAHSEGGLTCAVCEVIFK